DKLAAAEMKLASVGNLERGLNDLFGQIRDVRASAADVAERATQPLTQPALVEARRAPEAEARIVPRGTELRQEITSPPLAPTIRRMPRPSANDPETTSVTSASEEGADSPIEPGSGSPYPRAAASAAERVAQSEAALGELITKAPEGSTRTSDFIAAARRAAQAAAAEQSAFAAQRSANARTGTKSTRTGALLVGLTAMVVLFGAVRFSGIWMPLFFHPALPVPPHLMIAPAETPEDEEAAPSVKQSAMPVQDPALTGALPSGVVGPAPSNLLSQPPSDSEPTGSVNMTKS